jgi:PAS domain S-box-containing protein
LLIINDVIENSANSLQRSNLGMIENLIRYNPDAVLISDKENLKFLEVNDNALNLYGYRKEEFMQMDLTDLFLAEDIQLLLDTSSASLKEGFFYGPYKHKRKDGKVIYIEMSKFSVKYQDHDAHFNVVREISDKLEVEKRNQSFKSVFENTDDLVFITDASGFILFINEQVQNKLGFAKNELIDSSFASLAIDDDRSRVNLSIFHANKKIVSTLSISLKSLVGQLLHVDLVAVPVLDHEKEITAFTILVKIKESLSASTSFDSTATLAGLNGKMKGIAAINSKYLEELFHDLLTPINVILGYAQAFSSNMNNPTEEQREAFNIIKQNRIHLLQSMNAAIEFASLTESNSFFSVSETRMTDVIDLLVKDIEESKTVKSAELAYGKISSSLRFETDHSKFRNFLFLLFKIVSIISDQKKIYFSAYARDKEFFIVTYRDLQTYSSKTLITNLKDFFEVNDTNIIAKLGISGTIINLAKLLFETLKGKFVILSDEKDKPDYGIIFPFVHGGAQDIIEEQSKSLHEIENKGLAAASESKTEPDKTITPQTQQPDSAKKPQTEVKRSDKLDANLRNELRIEMLREKIRSKEAGLRTPKSDENVEENFEDEEQELVEDTIEYFDLDLQGSSDEPIEEEIIEITETTVPKVEKAEIVHHPPTDEKVDISRLSCLYFEDQIDSQILFRVQMKGLKNIDFAVSFEESLPLLDSGNYDFIVIDINLQGSYNGLDILRILRSMPKYENTPVFAVTAYVLPGDQQKFVLAGFNGFISKPIFRDQMIDLLAEVFNEPKHS